MSFFILIFTTKIRFIEFIFDQLNLFQVIRNIIQLFIIMGIVI